MMDDVWKRNEIDSPCVKLCVVHPEARICIGCHRTIDEISQWSKMSDEDRARVKDELPARAPLLRGKRRGRKRD
nr:DUF1289 domain-containing protein [Amylibacter sp.]